MAHIKRDPNIGHPGGGISSPAPDPVHKPEEDQELPEGVDIVEVDGEEFLIQQPGDQTTVNTTLIPPILQRAINQRLAQQQQLHNFGFGQGLSPLDLALDRSRRQNRAVGQRIVAPRDINQIRAENEIVKLFKRGQLDRGAEIANLVATRGGFGHGRNALSSLSRFNPGETTRLGPTGLRQIFSGTAGRQPEIGAAQRGVTSGLAQSAEFGRAGDAPGFQGAFEAAVRRAQPRISSQFALSGRSGGGLESVAQTQAAADAFAGLFNQERNRQLQASSRLADVLQGQRQRQLGAAAGLTDRFGQERQIDLAAAQALTSGLLGQGQLRLDAASRLPQLQLAVPDALRELGRSKQAQAQREIDAPLDLRRQLAALSFSGQPGGGIPSGLTSSSQTTSGLPPRISILGGGGGGGGGGGAGSFFTGALGGAATGASLGSTFPGIGTVAGAIGGGVLGGLGGLL